MLDEEIKEIWLANIPAALIAKEQQQQLAAPNTREGVYNRVLLKTGSVEAAEQARTIFLQDQALEAAIKAQGMPK